MAGQPITPAPWVPVTYGLQTALGAGVTLLEDGQDPLDPNGDWRRSTGFSPEGEPCTSSAYQGDICDFTGPTDDEFVGLVSTLDDYSFTIGSGVKCSTFGALLDIEPWHAAADRQLNRTQWRQIAFELWTGAQREDAGHDGRHLADPSATTLGSGAVSPTEAISLLEQAFSSLPGGPHVIHAPTRAMSYLKTNGGVITLQGNRWYTPLGALVVSDDGYPGTSPAGAAPASGSVWLYGTGPITARIDRQIMHPEPQMVDATRVRSNEVLVRAEKQAAVTFLCQHFAVRMNLS